jgi:predicted RNA-binding protein
MGKGTDPEEVAEEVVVAEVAEEGVAAPSPS